MLYKLKEQVSWQDKEAISKTKEVICLIGQMTQFLQYTKEKKEKGATKHGNVDPCLDPSWVVWTWYSKKNELVIRWF